LGRDSNFSGAPERETVGLLGALGNNLNNRESITTGKIGSDGSISQGTLSNGTISVGSNGNSSLPLDFNPGSGVMA